MTYPQLLVKRLEATGTALEVMVLVEDFLEHGLSRPAWTLGFDGVLEAADQYRRSRRFSLKRFRERLEELEKKKSSKPSGNKNAN